jgi:hypothetical protein
MVRDTETANNVSLNPARKISGLFFVSALQVSGCSPAKPASTPLPKAQQPT